MVWIAVFVVLCGFFLLLNLAAWRGRLDREAAQFAQSFKFSTGIFAAVLSAAIGIASDHFKAFPGAFRLDITWG
jgi:hypothetical protein